MFEWPFPSKNSKNQRVAWSRSNLIAVASGQIVSIYKVVNNYESNSYVQPELTPFQSFNLFKTDISFIKWCDSPDVYGISNGYLFIASKSGACSVFDVDTNIELLRFYLRGEYVISAIFSPFSNRLLYLGTNLNRVCCYKLEYQQPFMSAKQISLAWEFKITFTPDFLDTNLNMEQALFVFSKDGDTVIIYNPDTENGKTTKGTEKKMFNELEDKIVTAKIYNYWPRTCFVVSEHSVFLYIMDEKTTIRLFTSEARRDPIVDGFVIQENILCIIYSTQIRLFDIMEGITKRPELVKALNPLRGPTQQIVSADIQGGDIVVYTQNGSLQITQIDQTLFSVSILRTLCARPRKIDIYKDKVALACKDGIVMISNDYQTMVLSQVVQLFQGDITEIKWVADDKLACVVRMKEFNQQKVFIYDTFKRTLHSLLKPNLEMFDSHRTKIYVSNNRKYFVVLIAHTIIQVYNAIEEKLIYTIMEEEDVTVAFNNKTSEIWTVSKSYKAKKYQIDEENNTVHISRETRIKGLKGSPIVIRDINDSILLYNDKKELYVIDWFGAPPIVGPNQVSIQNIFMSTDYNTFLITTENFQNCIIVKTKEGIDHDKPYFGIDIDDSSQQSETKRNNDDDNEVVFKIAPMKLRTGCFANESHFLGVFADSPSLSLVDAVSLETFSESTFQQRANEILLQQQYQRQQQEAQKLSTTPGLSGTFAQAAKVTGSSIIPVKFSPGSLFQKPSQFNQSQSLGSLPRRMSIDPSYAHSIQNSISGAITPSLNSSLHRRVNRRRSTFDIAKRDSLKFELLGEIVEKTPLEIAEVCERKNYFLYSDIIQMLSREADLSAFSCDLCHSKERIINLLQTIRYIFSASNLSNLRKYTYIISLILGDEKSAIDSLLSISKRDPNYSAEVLKIAFLHSTTSKQYVNMAADALIANNNILEAIELFLATGRFKKAAKFMATSGYQYLSLLMSKLLLPEEYSNKIGEIIASECVLKDKKLVWTVCLLLSSNLPDKALTVLESANRETYSTLAEIIRVLCQQQQQQ